MSEATTRSKKMSVLILGANAMAAFMDFGVGALVVALFAIGFGLEIPLYYLIIGGWLALLPDFDMVPSVLTGRSANFDHHQTLFHRPFFMLPLVTVIGFLIGGTFWAFITFTCVFWHYLHDTKWLGAPSGIAWFWPFSKQYWSLKGGVPPEGGENHHEWLRTYWLRPTSFSLREVLIGSMALFSALSLHLDSILLSTSVVMVILAGIGAVWLAYRLVKNENVVHEVKGVR